MAVRRASERASEQAPHRTCWQMLVGVPLLCRKGSRIYLFLGFHSLHSVVQTLSGETIVRCGNGDDADDDGMDGVDVVQF